MLYRSGALVTYSKLRPGSGMKFGHFAYRESTAVGVSLCSLYKHRPISYTDFAVISAVLIHWCQPLIFSVLLHRQLLQWCSSIRLAYQHFCFYRFFMLRLRGLSIAAAVGADHRVGHICIWGGGKNSGWHNALLSKWCNLIIDTSHAMLTLLPRNQFYRSHRRGAQLSKGEGVASWPPFRTATAARL